MKNQVKKLSVPKEISPTNKQSTVKTDILQRYRHFSRFIIPLLFFSCFFLFLLLHIDPPVIYSSNGLNIHSYVAQMHVKDTIPYKDSWFRNLFILELTTQYLQEIVTTPGGWARLAVTLCIYSCHNAIGGTFVLTGIAFLFFMIFSKYKRH